MTRTNSRLHFFARPNTGVAVAMAFGVWTSLFVTTQHASAQGDSKQTVFSTPQAALDALLVAFEANDERALLDIFGQKHGKLIVVTDKVARAEALARLCEAAQEKKTWLEEGAEKRVLILGNKAWPFPIPLIKASGGWQFDTAAGAEEIINRRIGANEHGAIDTCHAYADAQEEYASLDHDDDEVFEYAQRIGSAEGKKDGLYWYVDPDGDEELSPLGPLVADSAAYIEAAKKAEKPIPFHGYYYKILTEQGASAPGGAHKYIINGNMIAGFALIAWPADYGSSGIMTFLVSRQGRVYEKDLGKETPEAAKSISQYNPDDTWLLAEDEQ